MDLALPSRGTASHGGYSGFFMLCLMIFLGVIYHNFIEFQPQSGRQNPHISKQTSKIIQVPNSVAPNGFSLNTKR